MIDQNLIYTIGFFVVLAYIVYGFTVGHNPQADTGRMTFRFACFVGVVAVSSVAVWAMGGLATVAGRFIP